MCAVMAAAGQMFLSILFCEIPGGTEREREVVYVGPVQSGHASQRERRERAVKTMERPKSRR